MIGKKQTKDRITPASSSVRRRGNFAKILAMILVGVLVSVALEVSTHWFERIDRAGALPELRDNQSQLSSLPIMRPAPPANAEVWECEVVVVGGSLGGVAAAYHAMQTGAVTCLIELTPMLGGQISSQGVSAIDESTMMRDRQIFSTSWTHFKNVIASQIALPSGITDLKPKAIVADANSCWVGRLCFTPTAGAAAAEALLADGLVYAPSSRWATETAFKGAEFNQTGDRITAVYGVRRKARDVRYIPEGRLSREIVSWYSWESDSTFDKRAVRLQAPEGKQMIVIDATDTGELVGWANIPHRLGTESFATSGEKFAVSDNTDCTQAYTYPFVLAIRNDDGRSLDRLKQIQPGFSREEHRLDYNLDRFPMFVGNSFFNYRRIFSMARDDPFHATPRLGDMTIVNWNRGNDWGIMNPPLILTNKEIQSSGQRQNWLGGLNPMSLKEGENHALLFSEWLMETQATPEMPLTHLAGPGMPIPTQSGLSMYPYIREGRRILGRAAYGQDNFFIREQDIRNDMLSGRDFSSSVIGVTHYAIDMHGCRYRNWEPSGSSSSAPAGEDLVHPIFIPLESLIPQRLDNLLIGGKAIAVSHIVNASTRVHVGEWAAGSASGATAGWILKQQDRSLTPQAILDRKLMPKLQQHLLSQGITLRL